MRDLRGVAWLFIGPTVVAVLWQLFMVLGRGEVTAYRGSALAVGALVLLWCVPLRRNVAPGVLYRLLFAVLAAGLFWLSALEFALDHVTILAWGLLFLMAAATVHATVLFGVVGGRRDGAAGRLLLRIGLSLSMVMVLLWGIEGAFRAVSSVRLYDIIPDDPTAGSSMVHRETGRPVGRPGFRGEFIHPEFRGCRVEFNAWGLRDGIDEATPPAAGDASVVVLGDSMTFGTGVALEQTFQELLEARAGEITPRPLRVYGGAIPGYSTLEELAMLEELMPKARPDVVIVGVFEGNDFQDSWAAEAAAKGREGLAPKRSTFGTFVSGVLNVRFWATSSAAFQALSLELVLVELGLTDPRVHTNLFLDECLLTDVPPLIDRLRDNVIDQLAMIEKHCDEAGAKLVLLIIPDSIQSVPARYDAFLRLRPEAAIGTFSRTAFHEAFLAKLRERGLQCADMLPAIEHEASKGVECYFLEGHLNVRGHQVAAEVLAPVLKPLL